MFKKFISKIKNTAKKVVRKAENKVNEIRLKYATKAYAAFAGTTAEAYVDTGVKILIAVVIGALLLGGLYALFNSTIMPTVTQKITGLFNYSGT